MPTSSLIYLVALVSVGRCVYRLRAGIQPALCPVSYETKRFSKADSPLLQSQTTVKNHVRRNTQTESALQFLKLARRMLQCFFIQNSSIESFPTVFFSAPILLSGPVPILQLRQLSRDRSWYSAVHIHDHVSTPRLRDLSELFASFPSRFYGPSYISQQLLGIFVNRSFQCLPP